MQQFCNFAHCASCILNMVHLNFARSRRCSKCFTQFVAVNWLAKVPWKWGHIRRAKLLFLCSTFPSCPTCLREKGLFLPCWHYGWPAVQDLLSSSCSHPSHPPSIPLHNHSAMIPAGLEMGRFAGILTCKGRSSIFYYLRVV